jgi:hypothetical protein
MTPRGPDAWHRLDDAAAVPASAASRAHAGPDQAAIDIAGSSSSAKTDQVPDRIVSTEDPGRLSPPASAVRQPGQEGGTAAAAAGDLDLRHEQWRAIQSAFVDDPRRSVTAAADLVAETVSALVASAKQRERELRGEWDRDGVDTEDLRHALRHYRSFLERLPAL